jgi:hypothetical protein
MKLLSCALLLVASMAFVLVGCSDNPNSFMTPSDQAISASSSPALLGKAGVTAVHTLRGSANTYNILLNMPELGGQVILPAPKEKGSFYNVVTIEATQFSDLTVSGKYLSQFQGEIPPELAAVAGGMADKVEGKVIQLLMDETGTKAKVVVEVTNWKLYPLPAWVVQVFIDKGEGASSPRDEVSNWMWSTLESDRDFFLSMTPQGYIDWTMTFIPLYFPDLPATLPIDHGNIQVR